MARHVAVLEASPLINGKARAFLEDVAFHHLERSFADALARTVAAHRIDDSPNGDELRRLLTDGGVITEQGGMIRFVPGDIGDYLAAWHVVRRLERGPSMLPWHRKYLSPNGTWPWPDSGTALFQAELWWREAQPRMRKRLNLLLSPKHRDPNVHFVAALLHRGVVIADDLRERTVEILLAHLADENRPVAKWRATLAALDLLEPRQAVDALETLAEPSSRTASSLRRFDAVDELTKRDPERGERCLRTLATTLTGEPYEKLEVAEMIRKRDAELGAIAFRCLAVDRDMGDLQTHAARLTGDLALWEEQVGERRGISDPARLGQLAALAEADEARAVRAAERFAETATLETTPVEIARFVRKFDEEAALRLADRIAWPTAGREVAGPVRRLAVHLIGELVPARRFTDLARLSREVPDEETQFNAATDIVDAGGPSTALHDLAANPEKSRDRRRRAARRIAQGDRDSGGRLLVAIAKGYPATDPEQLKLLAEAHALAPAPAAKAVEEIARDTHRPASFRIRAVELGLFDRHKTIELYTHIATTARDRKDARTAARKVLGMDQAQGEELMARLANKFTSDPEFQFSLALEAGARAKTVLHHLGMHTPSIELRLKAGAALLDVDKKLGTEVIIKIVRTRRGGEIRVRAARKLPDKQALDALSTIVKDHDREDVLFEAGCRAVEIDEERGKKILRDLAGSRRISPAMRKKIENVLSRDR